MNGSSFPATRKEALQRVNEFSRFASRYAEKRNHVVPGHENVSRISAALRTRVVTEREVVAKILETNPLADVEKFVQEVYWRLYWKGWLEMRPSVWSEYRKLPGTFSQEEQDRAKRLESGNSGVSIMDHFARELVETGYLHNHARMWFAAFWIHNEQIPWQLGADFFFRHLRDADAASNTLSWRWVAGLHTPGKSYLARRSNLERYLDVELLHAHGDGLERLESTRVWTPGDQDFENPPPIDLETGACDPDRIGGRYGLWIHEDDLSPEYSELTGCRPEAILVTERDEPHDGEANRFHLAASLQDAAVRAESHYRAECTFRRVADLSDELCRWAGEEELESIVALKPFVGPVTDQLGLIRARLSEVNCQVQLVRRSSDRMILPLARSGFFGFWKKLERQGIISGSI